MAEDRPDARPAPLERYTFAGPVHALTEEHPALPIRLLEESEAPEIVVSYRMTFADAPQRHPPETDDPTTL